ncbi:uncharacterized protein L203_101615 [Cryptococcus depauperatus CBS 7841]|uniref:Protein AF-9 homolog n=1 Tax=Cryptococcus depauperatus CBS 7841 TaxID=1295531 RepID=A0A1E3IT29_9TREE|nr:YEATS domain-containing protein 4 [Cryptococcus depauperatus CBS 7841]
MSNERVRGIQVHRPVIYGSHARLLSEAEKRLAPAGHTHKWTVFINSATSPPPDPENLNDIDELPGGADDLSYFIRKVTFKLHETYPTPNRVMDKPPFRVSETGWGEFAVQIRIQFIPESSEKPLVLSHMIKLHHWGAPLESAPASTDTPTEPFVTLTPAATASDTMRDSADVEMEDPETPTQTQDTSVMTVEGNSPQAEESKDGDIRDQIQVEQTPTASIIQTAEARSGSISVAASLPVHAWQYDEIVFSDPPRQFFDILNANPPTPLPPKNRRPKDQREEYRNKKKGKGASKVNGIGSTARSSRAGTMEGGAVETPMSQVEMPGEQGSADVHLEFTQEMIKTEYNTMMNARMKIVDQMDKWRERLIALEKELEKAKEEVETPI